MCRSSDNLKGSNWKMEADRVEETSVNFYQTALSL
jgi:hypothetical protein